MEVKVSHLRSYCDDKVKGWIKEINDQNKQRKRLLSQAIEKLNGHLSEC